MTIPLVRGADNRKVWINLRDGFPHPYTRADAKAWITANASVEPPRNFAIEVGGRAVGSVGVYLKRGLEVIRKLGARHPKLMKDLEAFLR